MLAFPRIKQLQLCKLRHPKADIYTVSFISSNENKRLRTMIKFELHFKVNAKEIHTRRLFLLRIQHQRLPAN